MNKAENRILKQALNVVTYEFLRLVQLHAPSRCRRSGEEPQG